MIKTKEIAMRRFFLIAVFCFSWVYAQYDYGLKVDYDEFTGEYSCMQRVDNSVYDDTGVILIYTEFSGYAFIIVRDFKNDSTNWVFSSVGNSPMPGDFVYIRFPNSEVVSGAPDFTSVETSLQRVDAAGFNSDESFILRLLTVGDDVRVRFVGTHGQRDFTVSKEVFFSLADGFGRTCMGGMPDGVTG
jgi:hypothetical protein